MTLLEARELPLMGRPESWNGCGKKRLELCPDGVLKQARHFFARLANEAPNPRAKEQVVAIDLVLEERAAHDPQQALEFFGGRA